MTFTRWAPALLCMLTMLCSGCSLIQDPQSYMRKPKLPEDKASLNHVIEQAIPAGASILRPKRSDDPASIYIKDLDNDGNPEAVVFYKTQDAIKGMLWTRSGDTWTLVSEMTGDGYELDSLQFEDLTNDGRLEIVAGYSGGIRLSMGLVIYHLDGGKLTTLYQSPYNEMIIDDLNQDQQKDITLVTMERNVSSKITTFQYNGKDFQPIGSVPLDPYVNGYYNIAAGYVADSIRGLLLDAGVGAHSSTTQLVRFDGGQLVKAFPDNKLPFRSGSALSGDINQDGIMEISIDMAPKGSESEAYAYTPWITEYYRWDGQEGLSKTPLYRRYYDYLNGFYLEIPAEWKDAFGVKRTENTHRFYFTDTDTTIFEWETIPKESWDSGDIQGKVIGRTDKTVTVLHLPSDNSKYADNFHSVTELQREENSDE
ncbi:VCBS repeat-containing protein [Paenibacillus sp. H1-7]|uniref:FG-GAP repeat domain-containing protein n=1 Tax=Paenibacillus sp. H1-7 TaxID=2282849 RepID=UPI001EF85F08|nr:VCBS repeat-containing protein [Paenibacillus sp. H1-7]ULL14705.1 VCBS repeat-containing protein [Paenibacillus sp. H1-7]